MQGLGVRTSQELINNELIRFCREVAEGKEESDEEQNVFIKNLQRIIENSSNRQELSLNILLPSEVTDLPLPADLKEDPTALDLFTNLKLGRAIRGINQLVNKYHCKNLEIIPDIQEFDFSDYIGVNERNSTEPPPIFEQKGEQLYNKEGNALEIKMKLGGRGQTGLANFYGSPDDNNPVHQLLIKEDDPTTCIFEGTAYFAKESRLLPPHLSNAANFAKTGVIQQSPTETMVVSIQPRVASAEKDVKARPWDEIVYGRKRNPKTVFSEEWWYPDYIATGITELNSYAQWKLAGGIFYSQAVGDESLHIAQFMALVDANQSVSDIVRIDFGARERFALQRDLTQNVSPYKTSDQYGSSGQFGKDYSGFLLSNEDLNLKVTLLWAKLSTYDEEALKKTIYENSKKAFLEQFKILPDSIKEDVLKGVLKTINRGASSDKAITADKVELVASEIARLDTKRIMAMKHEALHKFENDMKSYEEKFVQVIGDSPLLGEIQKLKNQMLEKNDYPDKLDDIIDELNKQIKLLASQCTQTPTPDPALYEKMSFLSKTSVDLLEMAHLNQMYSPSEGVTFEELNDKILKYKTINDSAKYCLSTDSKNKIMTVNGIIFQALSGDVSSYLKSHPEIAKSLSSHSGYTGYVLSYGGKQPKSSYFLKGLARRYSINPMYFTLEPEQRNLLTYLNNDAANFVKVKEIVSNPSFVINHALGQDEIGNTALHYLMMHANSNNKDSIDTIATVLKSCLGGVRNTEIDIKNHDEKTPLHYLLENPDAKNIIKELNDRNISYSSWSGAYKVKDFFDAKKYPSGEMVTLEKFSTQQGKSLRK